MKFKESLKITEKLGISENSKFRVLERMKWNNKIYLIEILPNQLENKKFQLNLS